MHYPKAAACAADPPKGAFGNDTGPNSAPRCACCCRLSHGNDHQLPLGKPVLSSPTTAEIPSDNSAMWSIAGTRLLGQPLRCCPRNLLRRTSNPTQTPGDKSRSTLKPPMRRLKMRGALSDMPWRRRGWKTIDVPYA